MKKKITLRTIKPYLFLIPIFSLLIIFKYIPFGMAIEKSFFNWNGANMNEFIGFQNFVEAFQDKIFLESIKKAFVVMVVQVLIVITVPLITAELLYAVKSTRAQYVVRTAFTFPMVVPSVVIILLWKWILNGDTGVLNAFLKGIGLSSLAQPWLGSAKTALGSILAVGFPWLGMVSLGGMPFLLYFGALQSIPRDLFEAADLDGVNLFQRIRCIDLPMLASQIKLMVTLAIINSLQIFDVVFILTKGGPGTSTMVPAVYMYEQGFSYRRMGYCSALGTILFLLIMLLTVFNNKFLKNTETMDYGGDHHEKSSICFRQSFSGIYPVFNPGTLLSPSLQLIQVERGDRKETLYAACRMAFYKLCEIRGAGHPSHGKYAAGNDLRYCYRPDCGNAGSLYLCKISF